MAKKSIIQRNNKRFFLIKKYLIKRKKLKNALKLTKSIDEKLIIQLKLQKLPRNSAPVRLHNRCNVSGRGKAFYRDFQLSRNTLREFALKGLLPGVIKSSW